jgi:putative ABC transport system permease protein
MTILQSLLEALESLNGNKLRSGLTILGIVIGVGAVIAMLALGAGAQDTITSSISGIGTNLLFVFRGNSDNTNVRNSRPLTLADAQALADPFSAPSVAAVAPVLDGNAQISFGGQTATVTLDGVTPSYFRVRNYNVQEGSLITEEQVLGRASVVLLGPDAADKLFDRHSGLIGETVRIEGQPFRVIGILESKGGGAFGSQDNVAIIPFSTAQARLIRRHHICGGHQF